MDEDYRLYLTADDIGSRSGGGTVTGNELRALGALSPLAIVGGDELRALGADRRDPFSEDHVAEQVVRTIVKDNGPPRHAHLYSGTFAKTASYLKSTGAKLTWTCDAHDRDESLREFELLGLHYPFEHVRDPAQFSKYVEGYALADAAVCPSRASERVMRGWGCREVAVIPHGVNHAEAAPLPDRFSVLYFGQVGPDKGVTYLLRAWKLLDLRDGSRLTFAGFGSEMAAEMLAREGWQQVTQSGLGGERGTYARDGREDVEVLGFVESISATFWRCSVYVQPSVSEAWGIEVVEAMMHGRPVVVSEGAGSVDVVRTAALQVGLVVPRRDPVALAWAIRELRDRERAARFGRNGHAAAQDYLWEKVRERYREFWAGF